MPNRINYIVNEIEIHIVYSLADVVMAKRVNGTAKHR